LAGENRRIIATRGERASHDSVDTGQHAKAFELIAREAAKNNLKPVRPFVLYSLRHTFLTRLGESGCDAWTLARIAGHSSIAISTRYVHPSSDAGLAAMARLGGHKSGQRIKLKRAQPHQGS
jgi:integrase